MSALGLLLAVLAACAFVLIPVYLLLYTTGSALGGATTSLAGNPAIDSADTDLSLAVVAVLLGLLFGWISHLLTRPAVAVPAPVA